MGVLNQFDILGLFAADAAHTAGAVAVARSGGIGLLDLEFCRDPATAERNFRQLLDTTDARVGLRLTRATAELAQSLVAHAGDRPLTLIIAGSVEEQTEASQRLRPASHHGVLAEITDAAMPAAIAYEHHGYVAKGHEAGGWVGADTSYILAQKILGKLEKPVFVQGGVGVHSAAGLRALGAMGVVLDDQLLLLAESPLSPSEQNELARLNGAETRLYGELVDAPCRVFVRPGAAVLKTADEQNRAVEAGLVSVDEWRKQTNELLGWNMTRGSEQLLPLGQGIGVAATYRSQFKTIGRLVQAIRKSSIKNIETAARLNFLGAGGPLAKSHGTRYPLAQGPMTRVSDSPEFAYQVSKNGGLPFLALALLRGPQVLEMLQETKSKMGDLQWGVGMLGFVPHSLREEQCEAVWKCKPTFALIAGGRPDQAAQFESRGIPTYIHAPAPALLKMYIEQGAKRFVFEGRECGGHIGPLASFPLWEQMIEVLLTEIKPGREGEYHMLFAGGIHDARSGAMLAALTAPLAARGIKVGALMGTAYLFTKEIVESGAIVPGFQTQALACDHTVNLETGPGHSTRCADTKFAHDFYETRRQLLREGRTADEIRDTLEEMNLGRLRIASKGVNRDASGKVVEVGADAQVTEGMYMIGQVATLRDQVLTVEELHEGVTTGSSEMLKELVAQRDDRAASAKPSDIAIVGIGTLLPKALYGEKFWENVVDKLSVISEVPHDRFDSSIYFDPNRQAKDKIYSKWGGFLDEVPFDPISYGIPPKSMKSIEPMQLLTLEVVRRALADAGFDHDGFDRENTSVILGAGGGVGDLGAQYAVRTEIPRFIENPSPEVWQRLPEWTEESFAGLLLNVAAGRVANRMDFGGLNFTVDAACASSLAAVSIGVNELEAGRSNVCIAGGIDTGQGPFGFMCFAKTQALSPAGKAKSFDASADGITISEGLAVVVMKRLADAERDGDRIYAVIKACAGSSDGKALGMTAPRPEGQMRALKRAYAKAGFSPNTLGMIEAHGTGTAVGDRAEAKTITTVLRDEGAAPRSAAIGSVKTILGHTKASAGVAGMIKVALSLYHRTLPAHANVEKPIEPIADPTSPVYLLKEARPWLAEHDRPRRGAASAFGFGGTNFHVVLEEYTGNLGTRGASGADRWPWELFVLKANDENTLAVEAGRIATALRQGTNIRLRDLAYSLARQAEAKRGAACTLAIVAKDFAGLIGDLEAAIPALQGKADKPLPANIKIGRGLKPTAPAVAFLFPGQGSQYVNMGREAALYLDELRSAIEFADRTLKKEFPRGLSRLMMPAASFDADTERKQAADLTDTRVAQPAIGALSLGYMHLAERLGLSASAAAGHSYGEYAALCSAGALAADDFLRLSAIRGECMAEASRTSQPGAMAAIQAKREVVAKAIEGLAGVKIANHNAPDQAVISGPAGGVEQAATKLEAAGVRVTRLPVSGAFHTELVASAQTGLSAAINSTAIGELRHAVYSNTSGGAYPTDVAGVRKTLDGHLLNSVEFVAEIEAMYAAGCRLFVELGPKGTLANMARQILAGHNDAVAVSLDGQGGGLRGLLLGLGDLVASGVELVLTRLFEGRDAQSLELSRLAELVKPAELPKHTWWVSGGCARPFDDPVLRSGSLPPLDAKAIETARAKAEKEKRDAIDVAVRTAVAARPAAPAAPAPAAAGAVTPVAGPVGPMTATAVSPAWNNEALAAYQQTMRQFLSLQERVVQQFFGAATPAAPMQLPMAAQAPALAAAPTYVAPAPSALPTMPAPAPVAVTAVTPAAPVAAVVVPAPIVAAAVIPAFNPQTALLEIVSERTGYPPEMLGMDQDLEAELGIDSIKRVEILGAFQKRLPDSVGESMQSGMERYTRAKTLRAIVDLAAADLAKLDGAAPAPAPVAIASASTPVMAPAVAPAATVDRSALSGKLLDIVSERTGYPTEMLGMDQDLEAELGIDSIKRVEILGALQKSLPASLGDAMQAGMENFTKARSLNQILDAALKLAGTAPIAASPAAAVSGPAPVSMPVSAAPSVRLDRGTMQTQLVGIVAERTGYPPDMLGMDQDLEAELGIDSIKRVEILGALQKALPASIGEAMQASMEKFTKARSLNQILDTATELAQSAAPAAVAVAAPVVVASVVAPAVRLDRGTMQTQLVGIVAERTGYPPDMLGMDQDLEAELGIDSIKRVEILGALQKALPASIGEAMQASMEKFTKARSLNQILDTAAELTQSAAPAAAAAATAPVAVTSVAAPAVKLDRGTMQTQLVGIVAERTGYPPDMLGMDQDLEAELGIDSIKRVEILGALQKALPASIGEAMQASMEKFTKARSLNQILDTAAELVTSQSAAAATTPAATAALPAMAMPVAPSAAVPRYVVRTGRAPLPSERKTITGLHIITADNDGVAQRVADRIVGAGGVAQIVTTEAITDLQGIGDLIARLKAQHGAVRGIVHLAGLANSATTDLDSWRAAGRIQAKALFFLMQKAGADLAANDSVVLSASRFGGALAREASGFSSPMAGAAVGLFNCAMAEWPKLRARLVDFEGNASADAVADALLDELVVVDRRSEVGYRGGERLGTAYSLEPQVDHPFAPHLAPAGDWVTLITGGARGITAEIAEELVRPGMRLVLLGRTPLPGPESAETASIHDQGALKKALLQLALAAGRKPTPVEIDREMKAVLADREIRGNIAKLTDRGAVVDYRTCDVRDANALGALIDAVYDQYGHIDAVLHGAGVIEDKRIADKTLESFDRVFDTKVDSAYVLSRKLKSDQLKLFALFTSVAGRFGNVGQGDYGAANETLNRFAWQLHHAWTKTRVVSINWGPWDAGMATDAIRAGFKANGIDPIPVPGGRRFFLDEMSFGGRHDVEIVAGEGPWKALATVKAPVVEAGSTTAASGTVEIDNRWPLIRKPLRVGAGGAVMLDLHLSLADDPYLTDHRIDFKPVLPAAGALEYMAQFVAAGYPEWQVAEVRDLRALSGIVLENDEGRDLTFRARSSTHSEAGTQAVTVEILDPHRKAVPFYRATVILANDLPEPPPAPVIPALATGEPLTKEVAYGELLFHTGMFRLIERISKVAPNGADVDVLPSSPRQYLGEAFKNAQWMFDTGLMDTVPQMAHLMILVHRDKGALPSRFGRVIRYGKEPMVGPMKLIMRDKPAPHEHSLVYDAWIIDASGRVRIAIIDGESIMSTALKRLVPKYQRAAGQIA